MIVTRLGSLNAVEQTHSSSFWRRFLKGPLPSADTLGRVAALMEPEPIRKALLDLYACLKRNKALPPPWHGLMALVLDGHESHATENRHCPGCLERTITTLHGEYTQYYHRHVTALLLGGNFPILLDAEPQLGIPSEPGHPFRGEGGHHSDVKAATHSEAKAATVPT
jgi:hypothetical protein